MKAQSEPMDAAPARCAGKLHALPPQKHGKAKGSSETRRF